MKATANLSTFRPAFQMVAGACGNRNITPVYGYTLVEFMPDGSTKLTGTDGSVGITSILDDFASDEPGLAVLEAAKVSSILAAIPDQDREITFDFGPDKTKMQVQGGGGGQIMTCDPKIHPGFDVATDGESCTVQGSRLATALKRVAVAADREKKKDDNSRGQQLAGIKFDWEDGLRLWASDGRRIATQRVHGKSEMGLANFLRLVPTELTAMVASHFNHDDEVEIRFAKNYSKAAFSSGGSVIAGSMLAGTFPAFKAYIDRDKATKNVLVSASNLYGVVNFALQFNTEETKRVVLRIEPGTLTVVSPESLGGTGEYPININYQGEPFATSLPGLLLLDGLKSLGDMTLEVGFSEPNKLVFFVSDDFTYMVMPLLMGA